MKAWDIFSYQPDGWPDPHPCVIVSHPDRVMNKPEVSILMCSSQRAQRDPKPNEVILDEADGLNWATLCKCDLIHAVLKAYLKIAEATLATPDGSKLSIPSTVLTIGSERFGFSQPPLHC